MRPKITRNSRGSSFSSSSLLNGNSSLSTLNSVSETPLTPCAVSYRPKVILSTPCGTIREEQGSSGSLNNGNVPGDSCMSNPTNSQHRRSYSVKTANNYDLYNHHAWSRRHSIHSQPQPLSVQGFGQRYGIIRNNRINPDLYPEERNRRVSMVAGRPASISAADEDGRSTPMRTAAKLSSPVCMDAIREHHIMRRSGSISGSGLRNGSGYYDYETRTNGQSSTISNPYFVVID